MTKYRCLPDAFNAMDVARTIYILFRDFTRALQISLFLDNLKFVDDIFTLCDDLSQKKQFCCILARHGITFQVDGDHCNDDDDRKLLQGIINNHRLSEGYLTLARDVEVTEPKTPTDIYKAHLLDDRGRIAASTAGSNLAATFINAFVNAGFLQDGLRLVTTYALDRWLLKNEEHERISAAASLGMIYLWDVEGGLDSIDKYLNKNSNHIIAGALLAAGIVNCGIKIDSDPALVRFNEFLNEENLDQSIKLGAIMGMGLSYAGTYNEWIRDKLTSILQDANSPLDVIVFAAISLGLVFVGTCNLLVAQELVLVLRRQILVCTTWEDPLTRLLPLSLGLVYLGKQESVDEYDGVSSRFDVNIKKYCDMTLLSCAYAGTGNILKVQQFMGQCNGQLEEDGEYLGPAVVGIAMMAMAEKVGLEMSMRLLHRLLQYGGPNIRRAVPLALALLYISDPKVNVIDTLSKLSHDEDIEVVMAAIISLGLIGAGTNNARIAGILRDLSSFYYGEEDLLLCVKLFFSSL